MALLAKLQDIIELPPPQRSIALRRGIRRFLTRYLHRVLKSLVFSGIAPILNRSQLIPFAIGYKPDSCVVFGDLEASPRLFELWTRGNRMENSGDLARFYMLYQNLKHVLVHGVPGDIVELGVYKGNSAAILAALAREYGRHTYLFDTFEGFDARDFQGIDQELAELRPMFSDTAIASVKSIVGVELVTYVKGYFPESLGQIELPDRIAIAHIDCDLYEPIKSGLEIFYPRISPGGILIIHDYSSGWWPGATQAVDEFFADKAEKPILIPDKGGTAIVRKQSAVS